MDLDLSDEQRLIRDTAREFSEGEIVPRARENDRNHHFDLELVAKLAAPGYLGAIVPREGTSQIQKRIIARATTGINALVLSGERDARPGQRRRRRPSAAAGFEPATFGLRGCA